MYKKAVFGLIVAVGLNGIPVKAENEVWVALLSAVISASGMYAFCYSEGFDKSTTMLREHHENLELTKRYNQQLYDQQQEMRIQALERVAAEQELVKKQEEYLEKARELLQREEALMTRKEAFTKTA